MIESDVAVVASARIGTIDATRGAALAAVPIELAVGRDERSILHGAGTRGGAFRYNIHLVETNRFGTVVTITVRDAAGRIAGKRAVLLGELEAMTRPLNAVAANVPDQATVELEVTDGAGRVIAAGSQIDVATGASTIYEMSFVRREQSRMPRAEAIAWTAAALALIASAIAALRRRR
jgi:hypothetical protein